jgi:hypothetical protein
MSLEDIIAHGTHFERAGKENIVTCNDGFSMSVIAHWGAYCSPRPSYCRNNYISQGNACGKCHDGGMMGDEYCDYSGPFYACEMGFPSHRPEPWDLWKEFCEDQDDPTGSVYPQVPVAMLRELVILHGGERERS